MERKLPRSLCPPYGRDTANYWFLWSEDAMGQPFISQISLWGLNFAVRDWAFCDGQLIDISQNNALFSLIGTFFGGNGQTNFMLPNLKGRMAFGNGRTGETVGSVGGFETGTLTESTMPAHVHERTILSVADVSGTSGPEDGYFMAKPAVDRAGTIATGSSFADEIKANAIFSSGAPTTESTGSNQPFSIRSPYATVTYEIAQAGIYPPRD